jgi:hypothetical protein
MPPAREPARRRYCRLKLPIRGSDAKFSWSRGASGSLESRHLAGLTSWVKALLAVIALLSACQIAAAQLVIVPIKPVKATHRYARGPRPIAIPQQIAPPQEAFASMPEREPASQTAQPSDCDLQLGKIAVAQLLGPLIAPGECGAPDAVLLHSVILPDATKVAVAPPATLRCTMATEVANWIREDVAPAAAKKLGSPLRGLENLGAYECRGRDRVRGATLSEHGRANALDVRSFKLANGALLVLADPKVSKDFREAVRTSACARFSTVLGPGSDPDHAEHVHVDLAQRRNNYKMCEWDILEPVAEAAAAPADAAPLPADDVPLPLPRPVMANFGRRLR